jgi:deazaflavin-dependent oxidoreductase (nitroreductase family)
MVWLYRLLRGFPLSGTMLLLTTRGRRSGRERTIAIHYQRHDGRLVLCASNAGRPRHPAWLHNLRADPAVTVQVGGTVFTGPAEEVTVADREALWAAWVAREPGYARMARRVGKTFPLVRLPSEPGATG